ncbi:hypothetical protein K435DRAFT_865154 [Dendrothele bispora CBS 962.96]|uniref:Uncharacterized protein n=1 Tax=Dendrothele bispora (strain CBS 962.96) TaxID=1314807 RepID=A0A4S8LK71_DENBC|nr:hypothetical protein K435DRAFT_865154 [Dendrothele bispora CBS 962.96]
MEGGDEEKWEEETATKHHSRSRIPPPKEEEDSQPNLTDRVNYDPRRSIRGRLYEHYTRTFHILSQASFQPTPNFSSVTAKPTQTSRPLDSTQIPSSRTLRFPCQWFWFFFFRSFLILAFTSYSH